MNKDFKPSDLLFADKLKRHELNKLCEDAFYYIEYLEQKQEQKQC